MGRFLNLKVPFFPRRNSCLYLALCWISGLLAGSALSSAAGSSVQAQMASAAFSGGTLFSLLITVLFPFLLSAFAASVQTLLLLFPIAFAKAFLAAYLGLGVMGAYGSAGWLIRWLLLFSERCTLPLLVLYWLRLLSGQGSRLLSAATAVFAAALIGSFDYCFVSPFLANVIS